MKNFLLNGNLFDNCAFFGIFVAREENSVFGAVLKKYYKKTNSQDKLQAKISLCCWIKKQAKARNFTEKFPINLGLPDSRV
jgi:hypothetical protein